MTANDDFLKNFYGGILKMKKEQYEEKLDEMWVIYLKGNPRQIVEYNKQLDYIKQYGGRIFRNEEGKHRIIVPN